jgi:ketosteroid isomerase-like protein
VDTTSTKENCMNKNLLALLAALACPLALAQDARETVTAFHTALHAGKKEAALELMSPTVLIYESGHVERSREEYAAHHLGADMEFAMGTTRAVLKHSVREQGDMALVVEETETRGSFKGKDVASLGTETVVLERKDGKWRIAHVHWSSRKAK